tara:strand:+ start:1463 stop:2722 length:1260 start_codon:yes stop_codon:yes gene_type:complete
MDFNPREVDAMLITAKTHDEILPILNNYGVAVIAIPVDETKLKKALKNTSFYNTANAIFKDEFKVPEPTMEEKLNPAVYKKRQAGDDAQGMLHQYGTPIHHLIQNNSQFRQSMSAIYGTGMKYLPNRLRKCTKFKNEPKSLHIEAHELFKVDDTGTISLIPGDIATIVGLTGIRRFGFWDMKDADLKPLKTYHDQHGGSEFTMIDPAYMHKHYPGRRRMINIDCSKQPHLIMWRESNPHEISHSPSLSLFLSPVKQFNMTPIKSVTSYQPKEYIGLTYHESNLLGLCYNMGGYEWPSGKKLYQFCHQRAYKYYLPKVRSEYKDSDGKFQMKLVKNGKVDQHTAEYQAKLKKLGIILPKIAFAKETPNFVVDITKYPITILRDYGFIPTENAEIIAAEALLKLNNNITSQSAPVSAGHLH